MIDSWTFVGRNEKLPPYCLTEECYRTIWRVEELASSNRH
ncbi:hypothetical protein EMEDMD4_1140024 [Sinorhizobium medicae]|nr:hypothetical protein EMEDMD4_1140024 [Sinorhizobium medicae]